MADSVLCSVLAYISRMNRRWGVLSKAVMVGGWVLLDGCFHNIFDCELSGNLKTEVLQWELNPLTTRPPLSYFVHGCAAVGRHWLGSSWFSRIVWSLNDVVWVLIEFIILTESLVFIWSMYSNRAAHQNGAVTPPSKSEEVVFSTDPRNC